MRLVTDALVLHAFDYLETSRILRLATRDAGLVSVVARGARRSVKRFGAALDLFAGGVADIAHTPGRDLHQLYGFDVGRGRHALADDMDRFLSASMLAEVALKTMGESDHGVAFDALASTLDRLCAVRGEEARTTGLGGAWLLVGALGVAPALDTCAACHAPIEDDANVEFVLAVGGALCDACATRAHGVRRLPPDARATLRAWVTGTEPVETSDEMTLRAHVRLLREFVQRHLTEAAPLRAFEAWAARFAPTDHAAPG